MSETPTGSPAPRHPFITKQLRRFGYVPKEEADALIEAAHLEADRERHRRAQAEDRFTTEYANSGDGLADKLDTITARIPVLLARHA